MPCSYYTAVTSGLVHELYGVMQGNRLTWEAINKWGGGDSLIGNKSVADIKHIIFSSEKFYIGLFLQKKTDKKEYAL